MATQKTSFMYKLCDLLIDAIANIMRAMLKFDRYVLKRYFGIETPIYKLWWESHSKYMQKKLDHAAKMRKGYELGMYSNNR